jgi:hypothetical protein
MVNGTAAAGALYHPLDMLHSTGVDYFTGGDFGEVYSNIIERAVDPTFAASYTGSYFSGDFNGCSNVKLSKCTVSHTPVSLSQYWR